MKILILGAQGQLGWELGGTLAPLGKVLHFSRQQADLSRLDELEQVVLTAQADIIVNAAAYTKVDKAETEAQKAFLVNAKAPALLAALAQKTKAWLVHYSTDYVYDGQKDGPYVETDEPGPLNVYGQTKLAGDLAIMSSGCRYLIFRTSWIFSEKGHNFPRSILELAQHEKNLTVVADQSGSPTSSELLSSATALALQEVLKNTSDLSGLYHLTCSGFTNWHEFSVYLVEKAAALGWPISVKTENIKASTTDATARPARRPANSRLLNEKFQKTFKLRSPHWSYYADRLLKAWTREQQLK